MVRVVPVSYVRRALAAGVRAAVSSILGRHGIQEDYEPEGNLRCVDERGLGVRAVPDHLGIEYEHSDLFRSRAAAQSAGAHRNGRGLFLLRGDGPQSSLQSVRRQWREGGTHS